MKVRADLLYKFILDNLDVNEIAKPDPICTVMYSRYYYDNKDRSKFKSVIRPSIADFLLGNLYNKWGEMISVEDLKWWITLSCINSRRNSKWRYKYEGLVEALIEGHKCLNTNQS